MSTPLKSTRASLGRVTGLGLSCVKGLEIHRLILTMSVEFDPCRVDPSDSDRTLVRTSLAALDGDLLVRQGGRPLLVGAFRLLGPPLPLSQQASAAVHTLQLFLDLASDRRAALAGLQGDLTMTALLRGVCEHWENPLFDEDGYQRMRVGDSGLSRALQAIGQTERLPLVVDGMSLVWEAAERAAALGV